MADALDSKSSEGNLVWVRLPPSVLTKEARVHMLHRGLFCRAPSRVEAPFAVSNGDLPFLTREYQGAYINQKR